MYILEALQSKFGVSSDWIIFGRGKAPDFQSPKTARFALALAGFKNEFNLAKACKLRRDVVSGILSGKVDHPNSERLRKRLKLSKDQFRQLCSRSSASQIVGANS